MSKWEPKKKRIDDIVRAAVEVFLEKGYDGTSMDAIAKKAQISKGGLYHHFESKDSILFYANDKLCEPIYQFAHDALKNPDAVSGIESYVRNYIEHWVSHQRELTFFCLTMTKAITCHEVWCVYEDYFNRVNSFLSELFEKGIRENRIKPHVCATSAITLLAALDGILVYLVTNQQLNPDDVIEHFIEHFVTNLLVTQ